jgi:nucleoside-diphosphate-sugar epimerase/dTDP-4-dehydrorhamnose 3,5-epimerase-like enzyme/SAM-dependent methyltransferase
MNVLVIGYQGFLGNALLGKLKKRENLVVGIDIDPNLKKILKYTPDVPIIGDIRDHDFIRRVITDYEIEEIYHLASWSIVKKCADDPLSAFDINIMGLVSILEACRISGKNVKKIVISTSDKAFGNAPIPYTEESPLKPLFIYDTTKACQQMIALSYFNNYNLPIRIIACSNIYGPGDYNESRVIPRTITRLGNNEPALLWKDSETHIREFVYVDDVVNAFLTVSEKGKNGEIYCCGGTGNLTVFELMKKICNIMGKDPSTNIKIIDRPANFKELKEQYIDASKLHSLGWIAKISLEEGLKKSVEFYINLIKKNNQNDEEESKKDREEIIIKGTDSFKDGRGIIDNYYLPEPINWIGLIETNNVNEKSGAVLRGNHYHPEQEQKVLVISGSYISVYKDLLDNNSPIKYHTVHGGDLVITPPNIAHTQIFLEDTILLNLVNGERKSENYGKHTLFYELVKPDRVEFYKNKKEEFGFQKSCRICGNENLKKVLSLGKSPLANNLLNKDDLDKDELFPLDLMYCENCYLCQLSYVVPPEKMFKHYLFLTSTTETTRNHFEEMADMIKSNLNLKNNSLIVDIGSNDGTLLKYFKDRGMDVIGVEPAENVSKIANDIGIPTITGFWDEKTVGEIIRNKGKADLITATNVFAHVKDIKKVTENVKSLLKDDGIFIVEAQYLLDTIRGLTFDNIYHEHVSYFSILSLNEFFKRNDMEIFKVERFNVHGGSIRVFVQRKQGRQIKDGSVERFLNEERAFGLDKFFTYQNFAQNINEKREKVVKLLREIKNNGKHIAGYGSPAKATTSLNFYQIDKNYIDYIVEDNPLKYDKFVPGVKIPIKSREYLLENPPDYIYVLAWNYIDEIIKNNMNLREKGVKFITSYPEIKII